ncbi:DOPA-like domain-containing protein [Xylogone sp. PMI_703]|nr:DOPA-like domain-containing protein [Xylogone sp. PMI_703]
MADPSQYTYPSPLEGYENAPPLPMDFAADGKSFANPQTGVLSKAYEQFIDPLDKGRRGGFQYMAHIELVSKYPIILTDVHIYFYQKNANQLQFAKELWQRIRREFPELRIYKIFEEPVGPHPVGMFEVNIFTPAQFGAFIPWLVIHRGPLSALIHPNSVDPVTGEETDPERDHMQRATWMGERLPLDLSLFKRLKEIREKRRKEAEAAAETKK